MVITMLKSKIHRAVVTEANINYIGSITIDKNLMDAAGLYENEKVHVMDINNGSRLETYVIEGPAGNGDICLNGAAARLVHVGDNLIIMSYCQIDIEKAKEHKPKIVFVDSKNAVKEIKNKEIHAET